MTVLLRPPDVGGTHAWQALALDGVLVPLWGDVALSAVVPETPPLRAQAIAPLMPRGLVAAGRTALWVHCGGVPPHRLEVYYRSRAHRPRARSDLTVRQATLLARDVTVTGDLVVTSLARTAIDLARVLPRELAVADLARLVGVGLDPRSARTLLGTRLRWAGREQILAVLDAVQAQAGSCGAVAAREPVIR